MSREPVTWSALAKIFAAAAGITAGVFLGAALVYGVWFVTTDADRREHVAAAGTADWREKNTDAVACRAKGGFPIYSDWNGRMIECRPLIKAQ